MRRIRQVAGHWHKSFDGFSTSALDFYALVAEAVARRQIPDVTFSRIEYKESGLFSAQRTYLRVTRGKYNFDICAAPFGNGFFFSWWLGLPVANFIPYVLGLLFLAGIVYHLSVWKFDLIAGTLLFPLLYLAVLFFLGFMVRYARWGDEEKVLAIPYLSFVYQYVFRPQTYFKLDTELMFRSAVN